jgi:hypothetical protein
MTMGIVVVASFAARLGGSAACNNDHVNLEANQLGCEGREPVEFSLCTSDLDNNGFSFGVAQFA